MPQVMKAASDTGALFCTLPSLFPIANGPGWVSVISNAAGKAVNLIRALAAVSLKWKHVMVGFEIRKALSPKFKHGPQLLAHRDHAPVTVFRLRAANAKLAFCKINL